MPDYVPDIRGGKGGKKTERRSKKQMKRSKAREKGGMDGCCYVIMAH